MTKGGVLICTISPALPSVRLPSAYSHYTPVQIASCKIVCDGIIQSAIAARKAGVTIGLGTDGACPFAAQSGMWIFYEHPEVNFDDLKQKFMACVTYLEQYAHGCQGMLHRTGDPSLSYS